jgi:acyl carrier protein
MTISSADSVRTVTSEDIEGILITNVGAAPDVFNGREGRSLTDLEFDSLAVLELAAVVQERFGVEIPEAALDMSILQLAAFINSPMPGKD